jgi:hypothetical protein
MVECPDHCIGCWRIFLELHNSRSAGMSGYDPIQYSEILAYSQLFEYKFQPWEIVLIKKFDNEVLSMLAKQQEEAARKQEAKNKKK